MAIREGYVNGGWMAGSETDKLEKANANKRFLADRDTEFNQLLNEQKTGTGQFAADYQAKHGDIFKNMLNERIAGNSGGTGFAEAYNYAGQDRFKQFLNPLPGITPTPIANVSADPRNNLGGPTNNIARPVNTLNSGIRPSGISPSGVTNFNASSNIKPPRITNFNGGISPTEAINFNGDNSNVNPSKSIYNRPKQMLSAERRLGLGRVV